MCCGGGGVSTCSAVSRVATVALRGQHVFLCVCCFFVFFEDAFGRLGGDQVLPPEPELQNKCHRSPPTSPKNSAPNVCSIVGVGGGVMLLLSSPLAVAGV